MSDMTVDKDKKLATDIISKERNYEFTEENLQDIRAEINKIDLLEEMTAEQRMLIDDADFLKLSIIKSRDMSHLLLGDKKFAGDSKEMTELKQSISALEDMLTSQEKDIKGFTEEKKEAIDEAYALAIANAQNYVDKKNPKFPAGKRRKAMVEETLERLKEQRNHVIDGFNLLWSNQTEGLDISSAYDLILLSELSYSRHADPVALLETKEIGAVRGLEVEDFASLIGQEVEDGKIEFVNGKIQIYADTMSIGSMLFGQDRKETVFNQQLLEKIYELFMSNLNKSWVFSQEALNEAKKYITVGNGARLSGGLDLDNMVKVIKKCGFHGASVQEVNRKRAEIGVDTTQVQCADEVYKMFELTNVSIDKREKMLTGSTLADQENMRKRILSFIDLAKANGVEVPKLSQKQLDMLSAGRMFFVEEDVYKSLVDICTRIESMNKDVPFDIKTLIGNDKIKYGLLAYSIMRFACDSADMKMLWKEKTEEFITTSVFELLSNMAPEYANIGKEYADQINPALSIGGSTGLIEEVESHLATNKKWRNKHKAILASAKNLAKICDAFELIKSIEDEGMSTGLTDDQKNVLIDQGELIDELMASDEKGMSEVISEIKNTRYAMGFMQVSMRKKEGYSYKNALSNIAHAYRDKYKESEKTQKKSITDDDEKLATMPAEVSQIVRILRFEKSASTLIKEAGDSSCKEITALREALRRFPVRTACVKDIKLAGISFKLAQKIDNSLYFVYDGQAIKLSRQADQLARVIEGDFMEHSSLYGEETVKEVFQGLDFAEDSQVIVHSRNMAIKYLAGRINKPIIFFTNCSTKQIYDFCVGMMTDTITTEDIIKFVDSVEKRVLINGREAAELVEKYEDHIESKKKKAEEEAKVKADKEYQDMSQVGKMGVSILNGFKFGLGRLGRFAEKNLSSKVVALGHVAASVASNSMSVQQTMVEGAEKVKELFADIAYSSDTWVMDSTRGIPGERMRLAMLKNIDALYFLASNDDAIDTAMFLLKIVPKKEKELFKSALMQIVKTKGLKEALEGLSLRAELIAMEDAMEKAMAAAATSFQETVNKKLGLDDDEPQKVERKTQKTSIAEPYEKFRKEYFADDKNIDYGDLQLRRMVADDIKKFETIDLPKLLNTEADSNAVMELLPDEKATWLVTRTKELIEEKTKEMVTAKLNELIKSDIDTIDAKIPKIVEKELKGKEEKEQLTDEEKKEWSESRIKELHEINVQSIIEKKKKSVWSDELDRRRKVSDEWLSKQLREATTGSKGQAGFMKNVMKMYFKSMSSIDQRSMFSYALRSMEIPKDGLPDADNDPKGFEEFMDKSMVAFLKGYLKGAGPLMQKILQGMPLASIPAELREAFVDMKSGLLHIPETIVQAEFRDIVNRSGGRITEIEKIDTLGAASVGVALLCRLKGPEFPGEGKEVVIKLLRPDVRNRMMREKDVMLGIAKYTDGNVDEQFRELHPEIKRHKGPMEATYEGQLNKIFEELDLTIEARNAQAGGIYDKGYKTVRSMKVDSVVEPTTNVVVLDKAEGTTVDKFMSKTDEQMKTIIDSVNGETLSISAVDEAKSKMADLLRAAQKRQRYISQVCEQWVSEGVYGEGFYHGDLHAGNIMVSDDCATIIDYGNATKLTSVQQMEIIRMMVAATMGVAELFQESFKKLLENTPEDVYEAKKDELTRVFRDVLEAGYDESAGKRIAVALIKAQEIGIEVPAAIYNFSASQVRLQQTLDDMNLQIKDIQDAIKKLDKLKKSVLQKGSSDVYAVNVKNKSLEETTIGCLVEDFEITESGKEKFLEHMSKVRSLRSALSMGLSSETCKYESYIESLSKAASDIEFVKYIQRNRYALSEDIRSLSVAFATHEEFDEYVDKVYKIASGKTPEAAMAAYAEALPELVAEVSEIMNNSPTLKLTKYVDAYRKEKEKGNDADAEKIAALRQRIGDLYADARLESKLNSVDFKKLKTDLMNPEKLQDFAKIIRDIEKEESLDISLREKLGSTFKLYREAFESHASDMAEKREKFMKAYFDLLAPRFKMLLASVQNEIVYDAPSDFMDIMSKIVESNLRATLKKIGAKNIYRYKDMLD